jgi:hypothetical protein
MKKLLLVVWAIGATVVHANSAFEFGLDHSTFLLIGSKNYEAKHVNQDLTVSIVKPKFTNPTGEGSMYLSENSDFDGVCKLFGLASYVRFSGLLYKVGAGRSVVIDASARFSKFDSLYSSKAISTITCNTADNKPIPVSDNFSGRYVNDDDSITIKTPKFMMNGQNFHLSKNSNLDGVCKLFGLTSYVHQSINTRNIGAGWSVAVDASARFSKFDSLYSNYAIDSLMCR